MGDNPLFLENLDTGVFTVPTQTSVVDQKSLLVLQAAIRASVDRYVYFEIGSYLGGTLVPHLLDPRCRHVFSVDKRPLSQLDERGVCFDYEGNSTQRMLVTLEPHVPASAFLKLTTHETDVSELNSNQIPLKANFAFIDAEHTNVAVFRDFLSTKKFLSDPFMVGFHDSNLIYDGLQNIECFLRYEGIRFRSFFLPDSVFVIVSGDLADIAGQALERLSIDRENFIHLSRVALWKQIATNASQIQGDAIGHL